MEIEKLKYPIGKFEMPTVIDEKNIASWLENLKQMPADLKRLVQNISEQEQEKTYRPEGWTVRQIVNHLADSHANAYIRVKLALTEENPTIKPYFEALWADLEDGKNGSMHASLSMLEGIHLRWVNTLSKMPLEDYNRTYFHPEYNETIPLKNLIGMYAWHGKHHLAQIKNALALAKRI